MKKQCKIVEMKWGQCDLYANGVQVMNGATPAKQDFVTIKTVDASLKGANKFAASAASLSYTFNIMTGGSQEMVDSIKAEVKVGDMVDLIVDRVEVAPFGRVWVSGDRTGTDVCDKDGKPIKFTSIQIVSPLLDLDTQREAERQRARGVNNGSMFEWDESEEMTAEEIAAKAEAEHAANPLNNVAPPAPQNGQQQRRH
jgi:hypothetical protein